MISGSVKGYTSKNDLMTMIRRWESRTVFIEHLRTPVFRLFWEYMEVGEGGLGYDFLRVGLVRMKKTSTR